MITLLDLELLNLFYLKKLKGLKIGNSDEVKQDENLYVLPSLSMSMPSLTKMVSRRPFVGW